MARRKKKEELRIGALGEDLETNEPVVDIESGSWADSEIMDLAKEAASAVEQPAKPKEQPKKWPFNKSNVINERKELEHIARRVNMKYDNPGAKKIIKTVTYDIESKHIMCKDYKIEY